MAFTREPSKVSTPTTINRIVVILQTDLEGGESVKGQFELMDQDGNPIRIVQHNLADHLTPSQIVQLRTFMGMIRTKANTEILGV